MLERSQPCSLRACSRDDPECGARRGESLRPLVPAKAGAGMSGGKKRHGGAPRGGRPVSWDARRLASAWYAASYARSRASLAQDGVPHGCLARTRTFLGAPPTPRFGVGEATMQNPGRKNAPRERGGVCVLESPNLQKNRKIQGVDETRVPFRLLNLLGTQPAPVRNDRRRNSIVSGLLFTMSFATATCRAVQRPSRIQVAARLPTSSSSPIKPANTGSTPMPRTTLASRVRSPSQSSPW